MEIDMIGPDRAIVRGDATLPSGIATSNVVKEAFGLNAGSAAAVVASHKNRGAWIESRNQSDCSLGRSRALASVGIDLQRGPSMGFYRGGRSKRDRGRARSGANRVGQVIAAVCETRNREMGADVIVRRAVGDRTLIDAGPVDRG